MIRAFVSRRLETGAYDGHLSRYVARAWAQFSEPVRSVALPPRCRVIGVGGATLGGSGKTPVVAALARGLAGARSGVVVVAHTYLARSRSRFGSKQPPRRVRSDDSARQVGDEAVMLARWLETSAVPVVVGSNRSETVEFASSLGSHIIVDSLLQTRPRRLALSILAVDVAAPWGSGACPPAGDLRARRDSLLAAADVVLANGDGVELPPAHRHKLLAYRRVLAPHVRSFSGLLPVREEKLCDWRVRRFGLALSIARPDRVVSALDGLGLRPACTWTVADHADPTPPPRLAASVEAWLTTAKCAPKFGKIAGGKPLFVLEERLELPRRILELAAAH